MIPPEIVITFLLNTIFHSSWNGAIRSNPIHSWYLGQGRCWLTKLLATYTHNRSLGKKNTLYLGYYYYFILYQYIISRASESVLHFAINMYLPRPTYFVNYTLWYAHVSSIVWPTYIFTCRFEWWHPHMKKKQLLI